MGEDKIQCYKPSGQFSFFGAIMLFLSVTTVGTLLFCCYVYFNNWCKSATISVFVAVIIGILLGLITGKIITKFKMRNTLVSVICVTLGFLICTYVKWVVYDYRDAQVNFYQPMKQTTAYEYYNFQILFDEDLTLDKTYELFHFIKANDKNETLWNADDFDNLLGTSLEEAKSSIEKSKELNAFDYTFNYRKLKQVTILSLLTSPKNLWQDIKAINETGRWSLSNRRSRSVSSDGMLIKGVFLWVVWAGELICLALPMVYETVSKSRFPFIERENQWATYYPTRVIFRFIPPVEQPRKLRTLLSKDPQSVFAQPISRDASAPLYLGIDIYISKDIMENYISLYIMKYSPKSRGFDEKAVVKYMYCDKDFLRSLYNTAEFE